MRKVIVTGAHAITNSNEVRRVLELHDPEAIIHGGAGGADSHAENWARFNEVDSYIYRARWTHPGHVKAAGVLRNERMLLANPGELVLAFIKGESRGTRDCIKKAVRLGHEVFVYEDGAEIARYSDKKLLVGTEVRNP